MRISYYISYAFEKDDMYFRATGGQLPSPEARAMGLEFVSSQEGQTAHTSYGPEARVVGAESKLNISVHFIK